MRVEGHGGQCVRRAIVERQSVAGVVDHPKSTLMIFEELHPEGIGQRYVQSNLPRTTIELIESVDRPDPEVALPILTRPLNVICAQALRIRCGMSVVNDCTAARVEAVQPRAGGKPQSAAVILRNVKDRPPEHGVFRVNTVVRESFSPGIESVEGQIAADPEHAVPVLEEGKDVRSRLTVRDARVVHKHFELVAVVAVEAVLCAEPYKAAIVLQNLSNQCLREAI